MPAENDTYKSSKAKSGIGLVILIFIAFISLGLPDGLLGVAWPDMRASFGLPLDALGILLFASTSGYLTSSFFNGYLMKKMGVGGLLAVSCTLTALALLGYTLVPVWWLLPPLAVLAGLGAGAIDAGLNTYVEENYGEGLMQWLHACFGIGVTIGPIIMSTGLRLSGSWRPGYVVVGIAQLLLILTFVLTLSIWKKSDDEDSSLAEDLISNDIIEDSISDKEISSFNPKGNEKGSENRRGTDSKGLSKPGMIQTLKHLPSWMSAVLFFIYVGIELTLGHWSYTLLTESRGVSVELAGFWVSGYWGFFTIGRILAGFLSLRLKSMQLLEGGMLLALGGSVLLAINLGQWVSFLGITLIGIAIAPIFPALVSTTSYRVGKEYTANTIGMQIAAAGLGGAVLPGLAGVLAKNISLEIIPVFLVCLLLALFLLHRLVVYSGRIGKVELEFDK